MNKYEQLILRSGLAPRQMNKAIAARLIWEESQGFKRNHRGHKTIALQFILAREVLKDVHASAMRDRTGLVPVDFSGVRGRGAVIARMTTAYLEDAVSDLNVSTVKGLFQAMHGKHYDVERPAKKQPGLLDQGSKP